MSSAFNRASVRKLGGKRRSAVLRLNAVCSALLLLGAGGGLAGVQAQNGDLAGVHGTAPVAVLAPVPPSPASAEVARSAITALANLAANSGNNPELAQAAIAAITNIALSAMQTAGQGGGLAGEAGYIAPTAYTTLATPAAPPMLALPAPVRPGALDPAVEMVAQTTIQPQPRAVVQSAPEHPVPAPSVPLAPAPVVPNRPTPALPAVTRLLETGHARTQDPKPELTWLPEPESGARPKPGFEPDGFEAEFAQQLALVQETPRTAPVAPAAPTAPAAEPVAAKVDIAKIVETPVETPAESASLAASLAEGLVQPAHAQWGKLPELALPPLTVEVKAQEPVAVLDVQAAAEKERQETPQIDTEEPPAQAAQAESQTTAQAAAQTTPQAAPQAADKDIRPTVFVAAADTPAVVNAPVPVRAATLRTAAPRTATPVTLAQAEVQAQVQAQAVPEPTPPLPVEKVVERAAEKPIDAAVEAPSQAPPARKAGSAKPTGKYTFNSNLLAFPVDLEMFSDGNPVLPGTYRLDVYLNDDWAGKFDIRFANLNPQDRIAQPCFDEQLLEGLGFDPQYFFSDVAARLQAGESICGSLDQIVADTRSTFNSGEQKLMLAAPQAVLKRLPRGYVDPKRWDAGITAATLNYSYNGYSSKQGGSFSGGTQTSHYLGLRSSLSLGDWRLRFRSAMNKSPGQRLTHRRDSFYVERGVPSLNSRLVVGESATSGHVFDSLSLLGAQLVSDTRMRPDSQNAFVPVIRGIAQSNAKVTVHQRGEQIFEMTVPPGAFVIDDLYPNGTGGDLDVTITEADGTVRTFSVTYANLPEMLRPDTFHYSTAVGRYRNRWLLEEPVMGMLTASYGLNNTLTTYGGVMLASGYHSASVGAGFNLPIGAVSADATWANTRASSPLTGKLSSHGYAVRLGYTKFVPQLDTDVTLAMYRYATKEFYEPAQAFQLRDNLARGGSLGTFSPRGSVRRNQLAVRLSHQPKGKWGALSLGVGIQDYWDRQGRDVSYYAGWGRNIGTVNLGVTVNRSRNLGASRWENQYMLTLSVPLGAQQRNPVYVNASLNKQRDGYNSQASAAGSLGEKQQINYNLFAATNKYRMQSQQSNLGASLAGTTALARLGASASAGSGGARQISVSGSGGVVAFRGGVVLSPDIGETVGIVRARGAVGARVQGGLSTSVNRRGLAVVPWLQPYRDNAIHLDPQGLSTDVELAHTSQNVAPTDGAVVLLNYETRQGYAMLLSGRRADGTALPFAAGVLNAHGRNVGYVAQGGQALIRADAPKGTLTVRWGPLADQRCTFDYDLAGKDASAKQVNARQANNHQESVAASLRRVEVLCR